MGKLHPKATFIKTNKQGETVFVPVNKRAKTVAKKAGKRVNVTLSDLKALKGTGSYKYYQYVAVGDNKWGKLTAIRV